MNSNNKNFLLSRKKDKMGIVVNMNNYTFIEQDETGGSIIHLSNNLFFNKKVNVDESIKTLLERLEEFNTK